MRAVLTALFSLGLLSPALAAPPQAKTKVKPPVMEFKAWKIKARPQVPQAFYILERSALGVAPVDRLERPMVPLLLKRAEVLLPR